MKRLGFIGYGLRSETMMKAFSGIAADIEVAAIADPNWQALKPSLAADSRFQNTVYYEDAEQMLNNQPLDGVFIGTRCNLHARYAQMVLEKTGRRSNRLGRRKEIAIDAPPFAEGDV